MSEIRLFSVYQDPQQIDGPSMPPQNVPWDCLYLPQITNVVKRTNTSRGVNQAGHYLANLLKLGQDPRYGFPISQDFLFNVVSDVVV